MAIKFLSELCVVGVRRSPDAIHSFSDSQACIVVGRRLPDPLFGTVHLTLPGSKDTSAPTEVTACDWGFSYRDGAVWAFAGASCDAA
jgi:hypothetical protein